LETIQFYRWGIGIVTGSLALCRHRQTTKFLSVLLVLVVAGYASRASAQQQTTQQLPLPTGKTQT